MLSALSLCPSLNSHIAANPLDPHSLTYSSHNLSNMPFIGIKIVMLPFKLLQQSIYTHLSLQNGGGGGAYL